MEKAKSLIWFRFFCCCSAFTEKVAYSETKRVVASYKVTPAFVSLQATHPKPAGVFYLPTVIPAIQKVAYSETNFVVIFVNLNSFILTLAFCISHFTSYISHLDSCFYFLRSKSLFSKSPFTIHVVKTTIHEVIPTVHEVMSFYSKLLF